MMIFLSLGTLLIFRGLMQVGFYDANPKKQETKVIKIKIKNYRYG
jgi:hypothetical protein